MWIRRIYLWVLKSIDHENRWLENFFHFLNAFPVPIIIPNAPLDDVFLLIENTDATLVSIFFFNRLS